VVFLVLPSDNVLSRIQDGRAATPAQLTLAASQKRALEWVDSARLYMP
jgi:hypothetical protein